MSEGYGQVAVETIATEYAWIASRNFPALNASFPWAFKSSHTGILRICAEGEEVLWDKVSVNAGSEAGFPATRQRCLIESMGR